MTKKTIWTLILNLALATAALVAIPQAANAQGIPGVEPNTCLAGKNKCVSKKIAGLMKCRELCQKKPDKKCGEVQAACEQKVMDKFDGGDDPDKGCFEKLEGKENPEKPESLCTTLDDTAEIEATADGIVADLIATLEGSPPPFCGDGVANGPESCDGPDLGGQSCVSLGFETGTLGCTAGCGFDVSSCATPVCPCLPSWVDGVGAAPLRPPGSTFRAAVLTPTEIICEWIPAASQVEQYHLFPGFCRDTHFLNAVAQSSQNVPVGAITAAEFAKCLELLRVAGCVFP